MNLYSQNDYRKLLAEVVAERKNLDPQANFQALAAAIRVPKSYLSRVLHEKADLSSDQAFRAARHLGFSVEEADYFLLLLDYARSGVAERRSLLLGQIRQFQAQHLSTEQHLEAPVVAVAGSDLAEYYLDPLLQRAHICLAIPRFQRDAALLAEALQISLPRLQKVLLSLERMRLIRRHDGQTTLLVETLHLPKASPLYQPWLNLLKLATLARGVGDDHGAYSFAVVFSADEATRRAIQAGFLDFLKGVESLVGASPQEHVYQMSFELFGWTTPRAL